MKTNYHTHTYRCKHAMGNDERIVLNAIKADFDILGFIDHNITVNVIQNDKIVSKKELRLPKQVKNVIKCKNPRCITSIEQELDQIFILTDPEKEIYRCKYCEEKYTNPNRR